MRLSILPRVGLAACALGLLAAAAPAADFEKYLPDDAQSVVLVNVKQIAAWPPFRKQAGDRLEQFLKAEPVQNALKDTGFDPLRDVDRVAIVAAASSTQVVKPPPITVPTPPKPQPGGVAPGESQTTAGAPIGFMTFVLVEGRFDADKLEQAAKAHSDLVKSRKVGETLLWEITPPGPANQPHIYVAMLDKNTLMATMLEAQALDALSKAAGKKTADLKDKQVRDALTKADPKAAVEVVASGDLVTRVMTRSDGKGGFTTTTHSLRDDGVEGFRGAVTLGEAGVRAEWTIAAKDADTATKMAKSMNEGVASGLQNIQAEAEKTKELAPLVDAMKSVKVTASGDTVSVEANATPQAVEAGVKALFTLRTVEAGPPRMGEVAPATPDKPPPPKKDK